MTEKNEEKKTVFYDWDKIPAGVKQMIEECDFTPEAANELFKPSIKQRLSDYYTDVKERAEHDDCKCSHMKDGKPYIFSMRGLPYCIRCKTYVDPYKEFTDAVYNLIKSFSLLYAYGAANTDVYTHVFPLMRKFLYSSADSLIKDEDAAASMYQAISILFNKIEQNSSDLIAKADEYLNDDKKNKETEEGIHDSQY